jgi:hypothetical protein
MGSSALQRYVTTGPAHRVVKCDQSACGSTSVTCLHEDRWHKPHSHMFATVSSVAACAGVLQPPEAVLQQNIQPALPTGPGASKPLPPPPPALTYPPHESLWLRLLRASEPLTSKNGHTSVRELARAAASLAAASLSASIPTRSACCMRRKQVADIQRWYHNSFVGSEGKCVTH